MVNYREILRLHSQDYSQRQIANSVGSSRNTVSDVLLTAQKLQLTVGDCEIMSDEALLAVFHPEKLAGKSDRKEPDYEYIHGELAKEGVTLTLLWSEYSAKCRTENKVPYHYSQFCDKYRFWARVKKATMRISHKPGDAMEVDWAGNTIPVWDRVTGESLPAYVSIAVLPCSCLIYAESCRDMKSDTWITCHVNAYNYFGGTTRLLIPDNLRTGITRNTRYETVLNRSYYEMAEYYQTAIVPGRVRHPKDKSHAENSVKYASTWIIAALRNQKFFSFEELAEAVREKLEELNNKPFRQKDGCRRSAFENEEKSFLKPLPSAPYEVSTWSVAKVPSDYLITDGKNKYSVPCDLIGEDVSIRLTRNVVEVFFNGNRVASHARIFEQQRSPIVNPDHMPQEHRKYLDYNPESFMNQAMEIGPNAVKVVTHFLTSGREAEQGFKFCVSLLKLAEKYGKDKTEKACEYSISLGTPSLRTISVILKSDKITKATTGVAQSLTTETSYGITRGASYFNRGDSK